MTKREKAAFLAGLSFAHLQSPDDETRDVCEQCLLMKHAVKALGWSKVRELYQPMMEEIQAELRAGGFPFDDIPADMRN
jgi:hypothetical protein